MNRHAFALTFIAVLCGALPGSAQMASGPQFAVPPMGADAPAGPALPPPGTPPNNQAITPMQPGPAGPMPPSAIPPNVAPQQAWQPYSPYAPLAPPTTSLPAAEETPSKPDASNDAFSPFGGLGMRGMGFGLGGDAGAPGYKALWLPNQPVTNQAAHLEMEQQDLSLAVPIWKSGPDGLMFSTRVRWETFQTDVILPDSGRPFPADLWNVSFGTTYFHRFDSGNVGGVSVNLGSASDQPFHSFQEDTASVSGFLRVPQGEHNAWLFLLFFSTNGQLADIPIPGVAYFYAPSDVFQATIGFPFATIKYHPQENWRFELSYALITSVHARAIYQPLSWLDCYAGYDWLNESYLLVDRPEEKDRFYYYEMRVSAGVKFKLPMHASLDISAGYAFDRYYYEGTGFSLTGGVDRVDVGAGPYVAGQFQMRW
jgi:hypothetical protein